MATDIPKKVLSLTNGIVRVGAGRGFLVALDREPAVITAAHCLPHLPPPMAAAFSEERTFADLVGQVGDEPSIWTECLFADPVADIAVLVAPDSQQFGDEWDAYLQFVDERPVLDVGRAANTPSEGWLYSKEGRIWEPCLVSSVQTRWIKVDNASKDAIAPGTSGSPIMLGTGYAVGVMTLGKDKNADLVSDLPAWVAARVCRSDGRNE
jgi:hypothetical protein